MNRINKAPGIYPNTPIEEYFAIDAVNASSLKFARKSMADVKAALDGKKKFESDATKFGTLVHTMFFEMETYTGRYIVEPGKEEFPNSKGEITDSYKNTSAYKQWVAENRSRIVIDHADEQRAKRCVQAVQDHPGAMDMFGDGGENECVIVWIDSETGVKCKARLDRMTQGWLADLKTTKEIGRSFLYDYSKYDYLMSVTFYRRGAMEIDGIPRQVGIVAVETEEPHGVQAAPVNFDDMKLADERISHYLRGVARCQETGEWPGIESPDTWKAAPWVNAFDADDEVGEAPTGGGW